MQTVQYRIEEVAHGGALQTMLELNDVHLRFKPCRSDTQYIGARTVIQSNSLKAMGDLTNIRDVKVRMFRLLVIYYSITQKRLKRFVSN